MLFVVIAGVVVVVIADLDVVVVVVGKCRFFEMSILL